MRTVMLIENNAQGDNDVCPMISLAPGSFYFVLLAWFA